MRQQVGLGRLIALGGPGDGAWITEAAAGAVLRQAAAEVPGIRLGPLRIGLADPEDVHAPVVPPPPGALPPGPLRLTADFAASATEPLPTTASRLRRALSTTARERLGLTVTEVDLRVTDLLDEVPDREPVQPPQPPQAREPTDPDATRVTTAALSVPGTTRLTAGLGGLGRAVHVEEHGDDTTLRRRHVRVEVAVSTTHRTLDVTRRIRTEVRESLPDHPTVTVLVTTVN
ncbi:hypothetical protein GCM10010121_056480 [Streptomyces brasiliensis]|uniref:Nucleopolyhedrovirus P10 family protein n=1 Tax=Streptomyces brasiliensis TaxID=1954 RepID=A0A917L2X4_9ACTN|nr:hypothetical protein GCM10010121_056480 [Streptomyces brasiliensis]